MSEVKISLRMRDAESLLGYLRESAIPADMREHLVRLVENGIREASQPEGGDETPRYVGEHGETKP